MRKNAALCLFVIILISPAVYSSIGPPPEPCILVNHISKKCMASENFYLGPYGDIPVAAETSCFWSSVVRTGNSPFVLSDDWVSESGKSDCTDYPDYETTTLSKERTISLNSVLVYLSNAWIAILLTTFPLVLAILITWFAFRKSEKTRLACILLIVFSLVSSVSLALVDSIYFEDMPPLSHLIYLPLTPLAALSPAALLVGVSGLLWLRIRKRGLSLSKNEKVILGAFLLIIGILALLVLRYDIGRFIAFSLNTPLGCGLLEDSPKYACYEDLAKKTLDASICKYLEGQPSIITFIPREEVIDKEDTCLQDIARANPDPDICAKIKSDSTRDECYRRIVLTKPDPSFCELIHDSSLKDSCYKRVAVKTNNSGLCSKVQGTDFSKLCYAITTKNPSLCDTLEKNRTNVVTQDACYLELSLYSEGQDFCANIQNKQQRSDCYYEVAKIKKDASLCDKVEYIDHEFCLAVATQNLSACEGLQNNIQKEGYSVNPKDDCYYQIALFKNNPSICSMIGDNWYRGLCERYARQQKEY
ncbi:MAG: hypothetical protein NT157_01320 [Candidatus Micrarchaeota archaeon]|nr:hypothetical protein [Candidatus Micrarchaeota archaeon]